MNNYRDIIIRPIITEKSMKLMEEDNKVTFEVAKGVNRTQAVSYTHLDVYKRQVFGRVAAQSALAQK